MSDAPRSEVLDDLYGGPPDDFVARRDAAAKAARAAGDRDLARSIAALRKPTAAAALVNALVRDDPGLADRVVTLGDALREAERTFDGRALRDLSRERRTLVTGLVARARTLGSAAGQRVGDAVAQEVDQTLTAALADPDIAREVTSGHLAAGREYSGFGGLGGFGLEAADDSTPDTDATAPAAAQPRSGSGSLRRVPRGRLTVVEDLDEPADAEDADTSVGRTTSRGAAKAAAKGKSAGKARPGTGKTTAGPDASKPGSGKSKGAAGAGAASESKAGADESRAASTSKAGAKESKAATGTARAASSATAAERRRRAAETARDAAADVRDRARKAADRATGRRDERRADLDDASQAARAAHDLSDELRTAMTDLRRRIAKADKDAIRAEDRLTKAERALHDEERSAIAAAQDLRRAERALQAADRELDALDDEPPA